MAYRGQGVLRRWLDLSATGAGRAALCLVPLVLACRPLAQTPTVARGVDAMTPGLRLCAAVERDAVAAVVRSLDSMDRENLPCAPLLKAVRHGSLRMAEALLDAGFDANRTPMTSLELTPLQTALHYGWGEVADLLIERGAELDPKTAAIRLERALRRDAPDTVLRLLAAVDLESLAFAPLHEAAAHGRLRVVEALLDAGFDANLDTTLGHAWPVMPGERRLRGSGTGPMKPLKPLHMAARHEFAEVAALLIERGADVNAQDGHGRWTPLHYALLDGLRRPGLQTANLLIDHGADVNAATLVMGWTPLHLAASLSACQTRRWEECGNDSAWTPDVLALVRKLIDHGADVNARTRVGGWTPADVAVESAPRDYDESREPLQAVLAALRAAGGKDDGCGWVESVPFYYSGYRHLETEGRRKPGCDYFDMPFVMPDLAAGSGRRVAGSFTAPGAAEWLVFEAAGPMDDGFFYRLASLQDQHGNVSPVAGFDRFTQYRGLCLDPETGTHTAIFEHDCDRGPCPPRTTYFHYDADAGTLVDSGARRRRASEDEVCGWREEAKATSDVSKE